MPTFQGNGLTLCYEQQGGRTDPPILLIHGLGGQLVEWPASLLAGLAAEELRLIRLDNRDVGASEKLDDLGVPDAAAAMTAALAGNPVAAPYELADMARDAIALLDHLGLADAHVIGVSMGGMIAQHLAISHPERVRSMTSIMSSTGNPELPPPTPEAAASLLAVPTETSMEALIAARQQGFDIFGGPHHRSSECGFGLLAPAAVARCHHPAGVARQLAAVMADGSRVERLAGVTIPTLVIHGRVDPLVPVAAGEDTAQSIPGARLELIDTMGHDLPEPLMPEILATLIDFVRGVEAERASASAPAGAAQS